MRVTTGVGALLAVAASLIFSACGNESNHHRSELEVVGGREAVFEHPAVVSWGFQDKRFVCTGTFVSDSVMITASHCFAGNAKTVVFGTTESRRVILNPSYSNIPERRGIEAGYDIAFVEFPRNTAPATMKIGSNAPQAGQGLTMIGYGHNDYSPGLRTTSQSRSGVRRVGTNVFANVDNGKLRVEGKLQHGSGDGRSVSLGEGDSGGPAIVNGQIVGIASYIAAGGPEKLETVYVNLNGSASRAFLDDVRRRGLDIAGAPTTGGRIVDPGPENASFRVSWDVSSTFLAASGTAPSGATLVVISAFVQGSWQQMAETRVSGNRYSFARFYVPTYMNIFKITAYDALKRELGSEQTSR